jgi:ABC-2 type transport system ATP-binding protein
MLSVPRAARSRARCLLLAVSALSSGLLLAACGASGDSNSADASVTPDLYPGTTATIPTPPASGTSRAGSAYDVYIKGPKTGDKIAFTVFEPTTITGGTRYPLILHSHGFGGSRDTASSDSNVAPYIAAGYGAISIDERGHGQSTGTIRVMDPDAEGQDLLAVIDWAEANLGWLAYGDSVDGSDSHNLLLGSMGGSYGGMYRYLIHNIDPKRRLDAMTPEISPNNLNFSLFPGTVPKTIWDLFLLTAGNAAGLQGGTAVNFDPYITNNFASRLLAGTEGAGFEDFFYYHSNEYFCGSGRSVATNGGDGTSPSYSPTRSSKVNVMFYQGVRDTLFNLSDGIANYECALKEGGDVRFLSYQSGHNSIGVVPDPGLVYLPVGDQLDTSCGSLAVSDARLMFFNEHLKGMANAADTIPTKPCLSIEKGSAVLVDHILHASGSEGTAVAVPATTVVTGLIDVPIAVDTGIVGAADGTLVAGIPHLSVTITPTVAATPGVPVVFVGLGRTHNGVPGVYDLIDNGVLPFYGAGAHDVDMIAVAAKLAKGDKLALLFYGLHDQFAATGDAVTNFSIMPVSITGTVKLPLPAAGSYSDAP